MISLFKILLLTFILLSPVVFANDSGVVPIVSADSSQYSISRNGLSAIFKMRLQQWRDGSDIKVYVLDDAEPVHKIFCKKILNVFPHQLRRSWDKLVFSGSGQAPTKLKSKEEMLMKIAMTPGAIGYISINEINDRVRVLEIE